MDDHSNQKGFTLLSMLIALSILLMITPFLTSMVIELQKIDEVDRKNELAVNQFYIFFRHDLYQTKQIEITDKNLILQLSNGDSVNYQLYGTLIRRQVNFQGHEPLLYNVQDFAFQKVVNGVVLTIYLSKGERYEHHFILYQNNLN